MDFSEYFAEWLIRERLAEARRIAARSAFVDSVTPARQSLRAALRRVLIRVGRWLLRQTPAHAPEAGRPA